MPVDVITVLAPSGCTFCNFCTGLIRFVLDQRSPMAESPFATDYTDNAAPARPVLKGQFAPKSNGTPFAVAGDKVSYDTATQANHSFDPSTFKKPERAGPKIGDSGGGVPWATGLADGSHDHGEGKKVTPQGVTAPPFATASTPAAEFHSNPKYKPKKETKLW